MVHWLRLQVFNTGSMHLIPDQGTRYFPDSSEGKESACSAGDLGLIPGDPWRRERQPTPVFLPGKSHGWWSLAGYSPWGRKSWTQLSDSTATTYNSNFMLFTSEHVDLYSLKVKVKLLSRVQLFATPWTVAYQAPPSMGFSRQEYCSGLPFPSPGELPNPRIEPGSPALQTDALPSEPPGKLILF